MECMQIVQAIRESHPFLHNLQPAHVETLLHGAVPVEFEPEQIILKEGDYADKFYLIHRGKIALECHTRDGDLLVEILGNDDVLGWSWLFAPFTSHFQARAIETTTALEFSAPRLLIASEENNAFGYEVMKRVAQLAIHRLQEIRKRLIEVSRGNPVELGSLI